jgi:hypothetical protein
VSVLCLIQMITQTITNGTTFFEAHECAVRHTRLPNLSETNLVFKYILTNES